MEMALSGVTQMKTMILCTLLAVLVWAWGLAPIWNVGQKTTQSLEKILGK